MTAASKLTDVLVENFKKLTFIRLRLGEHVTEISGNNGAGKSSAIDAINVLFEGMAVAPAVPIRRGAEECRIAGKLGELILERTFRNGPEGKVISGFSIRTPEGAKFPSPQRHVDEIIGTHMLDPLDFINAEPKKQFELLRRFAPGVDFEAIDRANLGDYDRRTEVNRFAKEAKAAASLIIVPQNTPDEAVDDSALVDELQKANDRNAEIGRERASRETKTQRAATLDAEAERVRVEAADLRNRAAAMEDRADAIERSAINLRQEVKDAEALPAVIDVAEIRTRIAGAKDINAAVQRRVEKVKHEHIAIKYERESKDLTERMNARSAQKRNAISQASIPVTGLGFGEGFITLNDLPFEQASTAEKLRTAFALIVALNPKVRLAWIRDASLLDDKSRAVIDALAQEYDCQVILETIKPGSANAIVLEDGHVQGVEPPAKKPDEPAAEPAVLTDDAPTKLTDEFALSSEPPAKQKQRGQRRPWTGPGAPTGDSQQ